MDMDVFIDKDLCAICLDEMDGSSSIYTIDTCNHQFHSNCIINMFINSIHRDCPLCRNRIGEKKHIYDNFKFELFRKYSKRKDCNKIIKNLFKKYDKYELKFKEIQKELDKLNRKIYNIPKDDKKILNIYRHNEDDINNCKEFLRIKRQQLIKISDIFIVNNNTGYNFCIKNNIVKNLISDKIKNFNLELKNIIEDKIKELEFSNKENTIILNYKKIKEQINKLERNNYNIIIKRNKIEEIILNTPIKIT